jgi:hypothetical protein
MHNSHSKTGFFIAAFIYVGSTQEGARFDLKGSLANR